MLKGGEFFYTTDRKSIYSLTNVETNKTIPSKDFISDDLVFYTYKILQKDLLKETSVTLWLNE